ncbi:hypothetical protein [Eubacterium ventriosum]|uniref:hypothetical protein n=1 Tax=Eubacterium ventriosum TaxID=39496 RepID=UPI003521386F
MKNIQVQMIDSFISSNWWKKIMRHFISINNNFEIRCWNEEEEEIKQALMYGSIFQDCSTTETSIRGNINEDMLNELINAPEPTDKCIYNKMTKYFTINIQNDMCNICSGHYGTELYIYNVSDDDANIFSEIMFPYRNSFSIYIESSNKLNKKL